ncbi:MAG: hypothetical protein R3D60_01605 [Paracoccaceae bacterium]
MKKRVPRARGRAPDHLVAQAERHLAASGAALDAIIEDITAGNFGQAKDLAGVIASLRKAMEAVFHERARLGKIDPDRGGDTRGDGALDLETARTEIRRRMARLRATYGAGSLPEQPDP